MRQVLTILWDSYRLLAAKKLFWVALFLTVLISLTYASIGFTPKGMSILFGLYHIDSDYLVSDSLIAEYVYMSMFTDILVPWWLGLMALVLALISVCPVFPDFLKSGSIDVAVSKPVNRVTLFLVKYVGSLFFVGIQVFVFCAIVFLAHGLRMETWNWDIFWAVILLTFVFSMIYCVAVLTAVWTRSTLFALLMALLVWGITLAVQWTESFVYKLTFVAPAQGLVVDTGKGETHTTDEELEPEQGMIKFYEVVKAIGAPLPKTREATYMVKKKIKVQGKQMTRMSEFLDAAADTQEMREAKAMEDYENRHSQAYVIGTSMIFQVVVLGWACFIFVRKDF